jgi:hypothetical protein
MKCKKIASDWRNQADGRAYERNSIGHIEQKRGWPEEKSKEIQNFSMKITIFI